MRKLLYISTLLFLCNSAVANAEVKSASDTIVNKEYQIFFKFDSYYIEPNYRSNKGSFNLIENDLIRNRRFIDSISIYSYASLEGPENYNKSLSIKRANSVKSYLYNNYNNLIGNIKVISNPMGENWSELSNFIENSNLNDKEYILDVINNNNLTSEDKKTILYNLDNGFVNNYLRKNLYWKLRNSSAIILWNRTNLPACKSGEIFNVPVVSNILKDDFYISKEFNPITNIIYKPLFALKTNLLFDVITALNVEVEVPIKNRFSIAAEWIFPFWKNHSSELTFQTLYGGVDFKYWFGNRDDKDVMTGWFCDIYGGYGKFDYQLFQKNGAQGKILNIGAGVGYAHKIAKNLRMEYALGVGLIRADYHKYDMVYDTEYGDIKVVRYPWKKFIYNWIGPTKAKVSLVWLINSKSVRNK